MEVAIHIGYQMIMFLGTKYKICADCDQETWLTDLTLLCYQIKHLLTLKKVLERCSGHYFDLPMMQLLHLLVVHIFFVAKPVAET